jgi:hypothetical protein
MKRKNDYFLAAAHYNLAKRVLCDAQRNVREAMHLTAKERDIIGDYYMKSLRLGAKLNLEKKVLDEGTLAPEKAKYLFYNGNLEIENETMLQVVEMAKDIVFDLYSELTEKIEKYQEEKKC